MLRPVMSREDWKRAKHRGRAFYIGVRVVPPTLLVLAFGVRQLLSHRDDCTMLVIALVFAVVGYVSWGATYDRTRRNYEAFDEE